MTDKYILDGHVPVKAPDVFSWARWFETADCRVAEDQVGLVRISTMFLGLDHNFRDHGPPLLFETMVLGGSLDQEQTKYSTWDEAERGHAAMLARIKEEKQL